MLPANTRRDRVTDPFGARVSIALTRRVLAKSSQNVPTVFCARAGDSGVSS